MALNWRTMSLEKPHDEQVCLVKMKHGIHEGCWSASDKCFSTYLFTDVQFSGHYWVPIEEVT
jgi:hypothetical protein